MTKIQYNTYSHYGGNRLGAERAESCPRCLGVAPLTQHPYPLQTVTGRSPRAQPLGLTTKQRPSELVEKGNKEEY